MSTGVRRSAKADSSLQLCWPAPGVQLIPRLSGPLPTAGRLLRPLLQRLQQHRLQLLQRHPPPLPAPPPPMRPALGRVCAPPAGALLQIWAPRSGS